ncbi:Hypp7932 [Branchiostoma lanceolatum]|uniref:Hypp7932 protein n=1 Tax=Branchiostoma lanceolatum TaxID=7740 RepID=A0A8K0EFY5_BRALA|nr:Hypp7932 [Branchiostoma lanceolatum]
MTGLKARSLFLGVVLVVLLPLTPYAQTTAPVTVETTAGTDPGAATRVENLIVFECISLWALIVTATVLAAEMRQAKAVMKYGSIIGPLVGCVLSIAVIIVECLPPNNGFNLIVTQASIAACFNVVSATFLFQYCCKKNMVDEVEVPCTFMIFQFSLGCMVGLGGTIASAFNVEPGTGTPGIVFGVICTVGIVAVFVWYICHVCSGKCCGHSGSKANESFKLTA